MKLADITKRLSHFAGTLRAMWESVTGVLEFFKTCMRENHQQAEASATPPSPPVSAPTA